MPWRSLQKTWPLLLLLLLLCIPALAQNICPPLTGDVDQVDGVTPLDAVLALRHFLGTERLTDPCQLEQANVLAPLTSGITPADARCILQSFLGLSSCLTVRVLAGVVSKGPVLGATITLFLLNPDGSRGEQVAVTTEIISNAQGEWTIALPSEQRAALLAVATGGAYFDEASATMIPLGDTTEMLGLVPVGVSLVTISPLTHALTLAVQETLEGLTGVTPDVDAVVAAITDNAMGTFSFNPIRTLAPDPRDLGTSATPQVQYATVLGAFAQLLERARQNTNFEIGELLTALAEDLADSVVDGVRLDGSTVTNLLPDQQTLQDVVRGFGMNPPTGVDGERLQAVNASEPVVITARPGRSFVPFILDVSTLDNTAQRLQ